MDEKETPRDDTRLNLHDESGMTRRDLMRRGAIVGGTLLWVAPAIQSIGSKAYAETGSPLCSVCLAAEFDPDGAGGGVDPIEGHQDFIPDATCCECVANGGGTVLAVAICVGTLQCQPSGLTQPGPC